MSKPGNHAKSRTRACALCAALVFGCHALAGNAQNSASGKETAERQFKQAAVFRQKLTQRDLRAAVQLYQASARLFLQAELPQQAAQAEAEAGNTLNMMSEYEQSIGAFRRSLAMGDNADPARCAAMTGLAWTEANVGRSADALRDAREAVTTCARIKEVDAKAYGRAVEAEGEAEFWAAQVGKATATLTEAKQLAAAADDADGEALSTMLLADNVQPDDPETAHRLVARAMELWKRNENPYGAARGTLALAYFAVSEGDYSSSECESKSALSVFERVGDRDNAAVALNDLGTVARRSGDLEAASEAYRRARKLFVAAKDELGEAEAISGLMDVSVDRNDTSRPELYARGLALARTTNNQALLATALAGTGDVAFRMDRFAQASAAYQKSLDAAREAKNPLEEARALGRLARGAAAGGDFAEALNLYAQALESEQTAGAVEDVAQTRYLRSHIYLLRKDPQKALAEIESTIQIIEQQRLRIAKFESRAQYFAWVHQYYAQYIQVLMALHRLDPGADYALRAFEAAEKSKVRALLDELGNTPRVVTCDGMQAPAKQNDAEAAPGKPEVARLVEPADNRAGVLTVAQIQAELEESTVVLEFALGEERSFAWMVDQAGISVFELPGAAEIRRRVEGLRRALEPVEFRNGERLEDFLKQREAKRQTAQKQLRQLGQALFGAMPAPDGKRLVIVPDGALQYVPFAALTASSGTPLIQHYELTMLPSASTLAALRRNAIGRPVPRDQVAVIADPLYELPGAERSPGQSGAAKRAPGVTLRSAELTRALSDLHGTGVISNLPASRDEALSIQKIFGPARTRLSLGSAANRQAVLGGMLSQARVVHFATHGLMDTRRPENSGLVLALFDPKGQAQDGYLRMNDIHGLKFAADVVVLSACESALGKDMGSEGIIGLPRAFLYAGAQRVIASLWKVDDEASAALMRHFYEALNRGKSPTAALNQAQLQLRRDPKFQDPFFWSSFFIEGEYR